VPLPKNFLIFLCGNNAFWCTFDVKNELYDVINNVNSVFANDKYVGPNCSCRCQWSLDSGVWCGRDGSRGFRDAGWFRPENLVQSTALGLRVAYSCQQSTRSRRSHKPYIDSTPFRQVVCGKFRGRTPESALQKLTISKLAQYELHEKISCQSVNNCLNYSVHKHQMHERKNKQHDCILF